MFRNFTSLFGHFVSETIVDPFGYPCLESRWVVHDVSSFVPAYRKIAAVVGGGLMLWGGVKVVKKLMTPKMSVVVDPAAKDVEGLLPGNPLLEGGRQPKCQVTVAVKRGNQLCVVGAGIRVENYLITPTHNGYSGYDMYLLAEVNGSSVELKVDPQTEVVVAADVSAFLVPEAAWSRLGVTTAKLTPLNREATVTVTSSCDKKFSVGTLKSTTPFGRVVYQGSTQPGFSGSAYLCGASVLGMHTHGGINAGGYESLYIYKRLRAIVGEHPEDSEAYILQQTGQDYDYELLDEDKALVRFGTGHYHLTTSEIVEKLKKLNKRSLDWSEEVEIDELERELASRDYVPECLLKAGFSGEGQRPAVKESVTPVAQCPPGSPSLRPSALPRPTGKLLTPTKLSQLSKKQLMDLWRQARGNAK